MADFDKAIEKTLKWEGGKTTDTGGFTNFGISQKAYPGLDIANLTRAGAKQIYRRDYWNPLNLDAVKDQSSAQAIFDYAVNAGINKAKNEAQSVLQAAMIQTDKAAGLVSSINQMGSAFATKLTERRINFYRALAAKDPEKYGKYLAGWIKRANSFFSDAAGVGLSVAKNKTTWAIIVAAMAAAGYLIYNKRKRA